MENKDKTEERGITIPNPFANNSSSRQPKFRDINRHATQKINSKEIKDRGITLNFKVNTDEFAFLGEWAKNIDAMVDKRPITPIMEKHMLKDKIDFTFKEGEAKSTYKIIQEALDRIEKNPVDTSLEPDISSLFNMPGIEPFNPETIRLASQMLIDLNRVNSLGAVAHKGEMFVERRLPSDAIILPAKNMNFYTGSSGGIDGEDLDNDIFPFSVSNLLRKELEFPDDEDGDLSSLIAKRIHEFEKNNGYDSTVGYHSNVLFITPELITKLNNIKDLKNNIVSTLENTILKNIDNLSLMTSSALDKIYIEYIRIKNRVHFMLKHDEYIDDIKYVLEFMEYTNLMLTKNLYVLKDNEILISKEAREERTNYYTTLLKTLIDSINNYLVLSNVHSNLIENTVYGNNDIDARMLESLKIREVKIPKDKPRYEENKRQMLRRQFRGKR